MATERVNAAITIMGLEREIADLRDELRQSQERERRLANILQRRCAVLRTALLDHLDRLEDECERALNSGSLAEGRDG